MHRFFAETIGQTLTLSEADKHHALRVLRLKVGETIELAHDEVVTVMKIASLQPFVIQPLETKKESRELPFHLTLLYVVPKGDKWSFVLQKAVEMGVHEVIALQSHYSVVRWREADMKQKQDRHDAIIKEASMQSKRLRLMTCERLYSFDKAIDLPFDVKFIASEHDLDTPVKASALQFQPGTRVALLIGSEGGFHPEEVVAAKAKGYQPLTLGPRILRTETAVIVGLSYLTLGAHV